MGASVWAPGSQVINVDAESTFLGQTFSVSAGQTVLTLSAFTYVVETGSICVFRGGQKLVKDVDYEETDATHVTLLITDLAEGETVEVVAIIGAAGAASVAAAASALAAETAKGAAETAQTAAEAAAASVGFTLDSVTTLTNKTLLASGGNTVEATSGPNGSQLSGFRNKIINGDARVWQRGSQINAAGYFLDRWQIETFGSGATGQYAQRGDNVGMDLESHTRYNIAFGRTAGTSLTRLSQRIEDARTLAGKTITLSFVGKVTAGSVFIYPRLDQKFGTGGSPSADTNTGLSACNLTTTATLFTRTVTLPSTIGKTFGSNNDSSLSLIFDSFDTGGFDIRITNVQLEEGSIATPFEQRPVGLELSLCQRYYQKLTDLYMSIVTSAAVSRRYYAPRPVEMRASPVENGTVNQGSVIFGGNSSVIGISSDDAVTTTGSIVTNYTASAEL